MNIIVVVAVPEMESDGPVRVAFLESDTVLVCDGESVIALAVTATVDVREILGLLLVTEGDNDSGRVSLLQDGVTVNVISLLVDFDCESVTDGESLDAVTIWLDVVDTENVVDNEAAVTVTRRVGVTCNDGDRVGDPVREADSNDLLTFGVNVLEGDTLRSSD